MLIAIVCWGTHAQAQGFKVQSREVGAQNLLTTDVIYGVEQMENGLIYLATAHGLFEFNGVEAFRIPLEGRGLSISEVTRDHHNRLWIQSFEGDLYLLEDSIRKMAFPIPVTKNFLLFQIHQEIWIVDRGTLFRYDESDGQFRLEAKHQEIIQLLLEGEKGSVFAWTFATESFPTQISSPRVKLLPNQDLNEGHLYRFRKDGKEMVWFSLGQQNLCSYNSKGELEKWDLVLPFEGKPTCAGYLDGLGYYIGGYGGLKIYDDQGRLREHLLKAAQVSDVEMDQEGNLLVSTLGSGLHIIPDLSDKKMDLRPWIGTSKILKAKNADDHCWYLGTNKSLFLRYCPQTAELKVLDLEEKEEVQSILALPQANKAYVFCRVLKEIDLDNWRIVREYPVTSTKCIAEVEGQLLMGTSVGLYQWAQDTAQRLVKASWINDIRPWSDDKLLCASKSGLYGYSLAEKTWEPFDSCIQGNVSEFKELGDRELLLLEGGSRLWRLSGAGRLDLIAENPEGNWLGINLAQDAVWLQKPQGGDWISLGPHPPELASSIHLNEASELKRFAQVGNQIVLVQDHSISQTNLYPARKGPDFNFKVAVRQMEGSYQYAAGKEVWYSDEKGNKLEIDFEALPNAKGTAAIYYRVIGLFGDWREIGPHSKIVLEGLSAGSYQIQYKGQYGPFRSFGPESMDIRVVPPFYRRPIFKVAASIAMVLLFAGIYFFTVRRLKRRKLRELETERLKYQAIQAELTAIRAQMNPHFIFNVLSAIRAQIVSGKEHQAFLNIGEFARLLRNVLDKSGREMISLKEEFEILETYINLENVRQEYPVQVDWEIDPEIELEEAEVPSLITQPFVENVFKHAFLPHDSEKRLEITLQGIESGFLVGIRDNGKGIGAEDNPAGKGSEHSPFAMEALQKRIERLNASEKGRISLLVESSSQGTYIELKIMEIQ